MYIRNYKEEYRRYHSSPQAIKERGMRNKARKIMREKYGNKAIKGKDIHHKNGNPNDNSSKNLSIVSIKYNRGRARFINK